MASMAGIVRETDLVLVNRGGVDYQTEAVNLARTVCEMDELPKPPVPPVPLDVSLVGTGLVGGQLTCEVHSDSSWGPFTYEWSRTKFESVEVLSETGQTYTPVDDDLYWKFTVKVTDRFDRESLTNSIGIAESGASEDLILKSMHSQDSYCDPKYTSRKYTCSVPNWIGNINYIQDVVYVFHVRSLDGTIASYPAGHYNIIYHSHNQAHQQRCQRCTTYSFAPFTWGDIVWASVRYKENGTECETRPSNRIEYEWTDSHNPSLIPPEPDLSTRRIAPSES